MAENEHLDATHSRKWLPVARAISKGASVRGIADQIEQTLCKRLRRLKEDGLLPVMIAALDDPASMRRLCHDWEGDPAVAYAFLDAEELQGPAEHKLHYALGELLMVALNDVPMLVVEHSPDVGLSEARRLLDKALEQYGEGLLQHLSIRLAGNPDWSARARPADSSSTDYSSTVELLDESLLMEK